MSSVLSREDLTAIFNERAGIREFDGGAPRAVADVSAYWDALGEALRLGTNKAGAEYLRQLGEVVHFDLDQKMIGLLTPSRAA